ncbi:MAG: hypothetical protein WBY24_03780, partial [Candidatus Acidiferrales bacterium]
MSSSNDFQVFLWIQSNLQVSAEVEKSLEAAVAFAESLSQWAYITIAASVALLFKDLHERPKSGWMKYSYWLFFVPGWSCLA